nr:DUF6144 family protein [Vallitalea guaymasensis]
MLKLKNNEVKKLIDNIRKYSSSDVAHKIALGIDLPVNPTPIEKSEWVRYISTELEKHFDEKTIKKIRMGCYCTENGKLEESKTFIKKVYDNSVSMTDFVNKMNEYQAGWYIKDGNLHTKYYSCPCPMLEAVSSLPTKTWCYCTVGYNKEIFEYVFNCEVDIELLESIKMGDNQCLMKIIQLSKKQ